MNRSPIPDRRVPIADRAVRAIRACGACAAVLALLVPGCSSESGGVRPDPAGRGRQAACPLAFAAETLEGWRFDFAERNARRRLVVYLADVTRPEAKDATAVAERLYQERHAYDLEVVAVAVPPGYDLRRPGRLPTKRPSARELAALVRKHLAEARASLPCVVDPDAAIVERYAKAWGLYRLDDLPAFYAFPVGARDPAGRPVPGSLGPKSAERQGYLHRRVLKQFGIEVPADVDPLAGHHPPAPEVAVTDAQGKTRRLSEYRGRVVVFVFIAEHCPRCKDELEVLSRLLADYGPARRKEPPWLEVLVVCTDLTGEGLGRLVAERGYAFPVGGDGEWAARSAFRFRGATPDTFVIDPQGRIRFRHRGYLDEDAAVLRMEVATLLGVPIRPMLKAGTYGSDQACRVCHEREHADWALTRHACAWETLVRLGKEEDPRCIPCHVVGYGARGGFVSARRTPYLRDVQCESCHGQNGCAAFRPDGEAPAVSAASCAPCHDAVHSPRFDFATHQPQVRHDRAEELAKLSRAEREARLRRLCSAAEDQLFEADTPYVGSAACGRCHPTEHQALKDDAHARALEPLAKPAPDRWDVPRGKRGAVGLGRPECIRCHVTGYGRPGGFPAQRPARPLEHPLAGVGCESCHGPGKAHADDPQKPRAIAKLGGTCPECAVLPICRRCHDDANAPDFDYRDALPKARHPVGKAVSR